MGNNPLISVIVPVYKVEKYLNRCIDSIVNQTYKNLEIILVDDGSPDDCPSICDEWAKKDDRIKVIHKVNEGLAEARNTGIKICTGDYVLFSDSDDYLEYDMIFFLYELISKYNADVSRCGFYFNYENDEQKAMSYDETVKLYDIDKRIVDLVVDGFAGTAWNKLYRTSIIKSHLYEKDDGRAEDILHNYRVYKDINTSVFCDIPKYHYVIRNNSLINNKGYGYGAFDIIRAKRIILNNEKNNESVYVYAVKGFLKSAFIVISGCIQHSAFEKERNDLVNSGCFF